MSSNYIFLLLLPLALVPLCAGQCTFPEGLQGVWTTANRGSITITSEYVFNFPISNLGLYTFKCQQLNETRYIVKTTSTFAYAGLMFSALICFKFHEITSELAYFYMESNYVSGDRVYFNINDGPWTADTVCNLDPADYLYQSYEIMVKDGNGEAAKIPCPSDLQAYWAYNFDSGSGNTCTDDRSVSVCATGDVIFNYTQCSTEIAYSAGGYLHCLANVTVGTQTYLTLYNNDSNVDGTSTFRFACWAFSSVGNDLQITQRPKSCGDLQNSTYADSNLGANLYFFNRTACTVTEPTDYTLLYALAGTFGGLFLICIIAVAVYFWTQYKAKQKPFRGRLEPPSLTPRHMNGHSGITFKPSSKIKDSGIPQDDVPINVMQLLRKDLRQPGGRDSPSSSILLTVNTPPQLFNVREENTHQPTPCFESASQRKNYHVLGGADQSEYGDLPMDDERSTRTPVIVLPIKKPGLATEEEDYDDYDDDDDDLIIDTPGRSHLVAATQGMFGEDPMCPASRLPGIAEDVATNHTSKVGGRKPMKTSAKAATTSTAEPTTSTSTSDNKDTTTTITTTTTTTTTTNNNSLSNGGISNIVFVNEDGHPLPPRTPTPPEAVETIRDKDSKLRVKVKRRASLTTGIPQDSAGRGMVTPRDSRGLGEPERGDDNVVEMVFSPPMPTTKVETGYGPVKASPDTGKKGGKHPGAQLRSRSAKLDNRRGEPEKEKKKDKKEKEIEADKMVRPKTTAGTRDATATSLPEVDEPVRRHSGVRLTRIDIPDLQPPVVSKTPRIKSANEIVDSPGRISLRSQEESRTTTPVSDTLVGQTSSRKMWLDPVRPTDNIWGKMSNVWKEGQAWPADK